jgi:hypothetical protein
MSAGRKKPKGGAATAANTQIVVINESTVVGDADVQAAVKSLQVQVSRDFAPAWGIDAQLTFQPAGSTPPRGSWWLAILDNSDQAGALGYHDLTSEGLPLGKVFAATDLQYNLKWTVTASHELLEMLGDPYINLAAAVEPGRDGAVMTLYAYEVCDACEADDYGYDVNGVTVSDFVYPTWFESFWSGGGTQFDYGNHIRAPFQLLPGGYISVYDVDSGRGWSQLTAERGPSRYAERAPVGSRRERRRTSRTCWMRSDLSPVARQNVRLARISFDQNGQ